MTTKTETTTVAYINNYRSNHVTSHIVGEIGMKTACGRRFIESGDAWGAIRIGRLDNSLACKHCLRSEEIPCEIEAVTGIIYAHKMVFFKQGNGICTKCGMTSKGAK